jgi:hypothetical protein
MPVIGESNDELGPVGEALEPVQDQLSFSRIGCGPP